FYYAERNGWFVFGSELRALLAHPEIRRDLDLRSVARYLGNGYVPDPHTILAGVQKLPPGHFLHLTAGKVRVGRYWDLPFTVGEPAALFPRLGELLDEPLADPAFLPTVHLARHIREWVTVALSGDGGDELLCGYPTFLAVKPMQWVNRLPAGLISTAGRGVEVLPGSTRYGSPSFLLKQFFRGAVNPFDVAAQI